MTERTRDLITGELTLDYFMRRAGEGWKITAVEWAREVDASEHRAEGFSTGMPVVAGVPVVALDKPEVPYGLRLVGNEQHLEENPLEATVLLLILERIVQERRISEIASELNGKGYRTRTGTSWSPATVFDLLPRLIEVGPQLLKSQQWEQRRPHYAPPPQ